MLLRAMEVGTQNLVPLHAIKQEQISQRVIHLFGGSKPLGHVVKEFLLVEDWLFYQVDCHTGLIPAICMDWIGGHFTAPCPGDSRWPR
ncbi:hypothetical protein D3C85_1591150 [compost metagenome]